MSDNWVEVSIEEVETSEFIIDFVGRKTEQK